ncbi:hypothetical protein JCM11251_000902 [Rhodosporidiobolus azoricus]
MPVFKQIAKQQKRAKRKAEAILSDEESASDSEVDSGASDSDADSGSDEDVSDSDEAEEDDGLGGAGADAPLDENAPRPPPEGFPTAQEALDNPVASTASLIAAMKVDGEPDDEDADEEDAPLVCVFCPSKVLKKGKMTEVHLASKDHKRRLARFKAHLESPEFPSDHLTADARWVSSQLDKAVLERLSLQTQVGGKKAGTVKPSASSTSSTAAKPTPSTPSAAAATPSKKGKGKAPSTPSASTPAASTSTPTSAAAAAKKQAAIAAAEEAGTSVREQLRVQQKEENKKKRERKAGKKEKNDRIKKRKIDDGETVTPHIPSKPKFVEKVRPSDDEIAQRQAWKKARDEAVQAGRKPPPRPVFAFEHGGKLPETKKGKKQQGKGNKAAAASGSGSQRPAEKKERVVNEARLAKRKLRKETRKAAKAEGKVKAAEEAKQAEVLPEV